jgi:N-acetylglutamate synthase-like GNAT family acetyltransferase
MNIRTATMADLSQLAEIEAICFPAAEAASLESIRARLNAFPNHFWVLEEDERIISFVNGMVTDQRDLTDNLYENAALHTEDGQWQMIFGVDTLPDYRKKGYAGQLLRRAISDARQQGRLGLVLTCKDRLVHYYASFGFQDEGVCSSTHGGAVWHQMRLTFPKE